ncbi:alcohol dehydrogenase (ATA1) [Arabidopsis thaliana]|uniref:Short-chain dehydrogenase reductase ATA1 n=1 Tax=Arabidopsis thaliana TaxID=3702 RepID=ATA1_ARATH|nr:TAPETUM 1 [Arabidopsis thaliana]Q9M1K9.1 RecName: Full=Short-chain dehydrogenase reductase ATA1; AltName: Full=Protein TAPETUM 1; Short=ATA1; AltName: Full=Tasselseed-2 homolog ATA1 [Arabidopsis thaliana]ABK32159.1 At3g42960 [Arabidopsis thaliana]AEE77761.1 TAPETUM 1 [Arabidopsis thaliana]CAB86683.1 alcohol dehydrogenase (ATA1) [Arabidopsis thaliana]|eukprot:NP_189882.1 TAPETUM 1 [Arabidopsis thaliana]
MANSDKRLFEKVAIITGGARGIGAATARLFTENGAYVIVADILENEGILVAESIGGCYVHCDVSKEADVEAAVELAMRRKGRLDVMFNNAGMSLNEGSIMGMDVDMVNKLVSVNVNGVLHGIKHAAKAMIKGGRGGSIICTSSSSGLMGGLGGHAYTLSKGAINGVVRTTACELGSHGIRVNSISPHGVPTDILVNAYRKFLNHDKLNVAEVTDIIAEKGSLLTGRAGTVEDVAQAALFLASQESSGFITGHNLVVDGGYTSATSTMRFIYN